MAAAENCGRPVEQADKLLWPSQRAKLGLGDLTQAAAIHTSTDGSGHCTRALVRWVGRRCQQSAKGRKISPAREVLKSTLHTTNQRARIEHVSTQGPLLGETAYSAELTPSLLVLEGEAAPASEVLQVRDLSVRSLAVVLAGLCQRLLCRSCTGVLFPPDDAYRARASRDYYPDQSIASAAMSGPLSSPTTGKSIDALTSLQSLSYVV